MRTKKIKNMIIGNIIMLIGITTIFIPQAIVWKMLYGHFFVSPYILGGERFNFLHPQIIGLLFNGKSGLFIWTPIYIFLIGGFYFFRRINTPLTIFSIAFFVLQLYLISSWTGWTQGEAFSIRMLLSAIPFLSFGLGAFLQKIKSRFGNKTSVRFSSIIVTFNLVAIFYFLVYSQTATFDRIYNTQKEALRRIEKVTHIKLY